MKIKIFCIEQLNEAIEKCHQQALEYCRDLDGSDTDDDWVATVATMIFKDNYTLTDDMKLLMDADDALLQDS